MLNTTLREDMLALPKKIVFTQVHAIAVSTALSGTDVGLASFLYHPSCPIISRSTISFLRSLRKLGCLSDSPGDLLLYIFWIAAFPKYRDHLLTPVKTCKYIT